MYSRVAARVVLVFMTTLSDNISILPVFLTGIVAIACTGHRAVQYYSLHKVLSRSNSPSVSKVTISSMTTSKSNTITFTINQYHLHHCSIDIPVCKIQYLCRLNKPGCVPLTGNRDTFIALASSFAVSPSLTLRALPAAIFIQVCHPNNK